MYTFQRTYTILTVAPRTKMADGDGEDGAGDRKGGRKGCTARELYIYKAKPAKESRRSWQEEKEGIACSFGCKKCFHMLPRFVLACSRRRGLGFQG
jgi:hypothetical protein